MNTEGLYRNTRDYCLLDNHGGWYFSSLDELADVVNEKLKWSVSDHQLESDYNKIAPLELLLWSN